MKEKLKWFGVGFLLVLIGAGGLLWIKRGTVEHRVLDALIKKIQPKLPFKIKSYELSKNLDFLTIDILWNETEANLSGPLHFEWLKSQELFKGTFDPELKIEGATPLKLKINAEVPTHLESVKLVSLEIIESDFKWKSRGIDLKKLGLLATLEGTSAHAELHSASIAWADPLHDQHAVNMEKLLLTLVIPDFHHPAVTTLTLKGGNGEILWDKFYAELALAKLPLLVDIKSENDLSLTLGLKNELISEIKKGETSTNISFKTSALPLPALAPWLIKTFSSVLPSLKSFSTLTIKSGTLNARGSIHYPTVGLVEIHSLELEGKKISLLSPESHFAAKNISFTIPYDSTALHHELTIAAETLAYRHLTGKLAKTIFHWDENQFEIKENLPLILKSLPLTIGPIHAKLKPTFELHTSLGLKNTPLDSITSAFCVAPGKFPPASLNINFSDLEVAPGVFDPTGKVNVDFFKGKIELNDIGFYDLTTDIPEIDFDVEWSGIDLQSLGNWANFGEIKGTLEGYAHNVVFQSFLPTHYLFKVETLPLDKDRWNAHVEFSPEAMKNVVKVFTGASLDEQIPGIAGWMMFGWPSHIFGGYDVYYAGLKLSSEEGIITVETLDLPEILQKEQKHFVIYGPRFKMPLRNASYPILIDATSMSNFVHQLVVQLDSIKKAKKEGTPENVEPEIVCEPPEL